jgi:hypothetical protein
MKRIEEKVKRTWKYLRVSFQQTRGRDRLHLYLFALTMLIYTWWVTLVF